MPPTLQVDLLTLKVVSMSSVMWATYVSILVFLGISVLDLGRCTRQKTEVRCTSLLNSPYPRGGSIISHCSG